MLNAFVAVAFELSFTWAVKLAVPAAVGVPVIEPSAPSDNPAGRAPTDTVQEYPPVPPVAAKLC
jgi:hypothetical protein